ncbi:MAG: Ldh family oxidoreductase [Anaerolineae bacterium]|nr:Ldh family oxidoreductase [Anaerolineae bacterium]
MARIALEQLRQTALTILRGSGYSEDEAAAMLDVMLYAQMRGNNQGVVKLIGPGMPRDPNSQPPRIVHETPISARIDGGRSAGMVAVRYALDIAIERARAQGIALVGVFNTYSSTGAIGYYANDLARAGLVGFVFAGSGEYVAPHGSYEAQFGTNPLAIGVPTKGKPIVLDMATSAIARYGIVEAHTAGRALPPDVAYDAAGQPTTDAAAALAGAIRTFGGHKGGGLSLIVEILTGALVGTERAADGRKVDWGTLLLALDPALLTDFDGFIERVGQVVGRVKGSKRLPGIEEILMPGERGDQRAEAVQQSGMIELDDSLWSALQAVAAK